MQLIQILTQQTCIAIQDAVIKKEHYLTMQLKVIIRLWQQTKTYQMFKSDQESYSETKKKMLKKLWLILKMLSKLIIAILRHQQMLLKFTNSLEITKKLKVLPKCAQIKIVRINTPKRYVRNNQNNDMQQMIIRICLLYQNINIIVINIQQTMEKIRNVEKFPFKKILLLNWYQTAISHLLLFKYLKQKHNNCVYFLISEQGVLLKTTSPAILKSVQQQIDRFFIAKIEKLQISQTPQFYQDILKDIQQETDKLKDNRDCPYINLIYSQKLKNSCLAMRKFGYSKPYENWQAHERQKKGFCYLIVRPEHRWKQIAGNVLSLVKKRQTNKTQNQQTHIWPVQISYQKFIWLYLRQQFNDSKKNMQIKQNKTDNTLNVLLNKELTEYSDLQRQLSSIKFKYLQKKFKLKGSNKPSNIVILSSFQLQKLTQLIYHEFGLPKLVRQLRRKCSAYIAIGSELQNYLTQDQCRHILQQRQDIDRINWQTLKHICKLGRKHSIVEHQGTNYVLVRFDRPLKKNIQKMLSTRLPCLPKYYCYFQKDSYIYMLRKYQLVKLKTFLQDNKQNLIGQIQIMASFIQTLKYMHSKNINVGPKFADNVFVDQNKVFIQPSENGSNVQDISKLTLMLRQWVKQMKSSQVKEQLQKLDSPSEMLQVLDNYLYE